MTLTEKKIGQTIVLYFDNLKYDQNTFITDATLDFIFTVVENDAQRSERLRLESDDADGMEVGLVDDKVVITVRFNTGASFWDTSAQYEFDLWCIDPDRGPPEDVGLFPLAEGDFKLTARDTKGLALT